MKNRLLSNPGKRFSFFKGGISTFFITISLSIIFVTSIVGQPILRKHIGLNSIPKSLDVICPIVTYLPYFELYGPNVGDTAFDFTLYDREENPLTLSTVLAKKKPVLLICGSYTCTVFRSKVDVINNLIQKFGDKVNIYIVYNFEAHPTDDPPYHSDNEDEDNQNREEGIQYIQPRTYGERKAVAGDMLKAMMINAPIIFDGPCNEWSNVYGPAPNNAYLINTDGIVAAKHGWFDRFPNDIDLDINNLLTGSSNNNSDVDTGTFSVQLESTDSVTGIPGATIQVVGNIVNESDADAIVKIKRTHTDLPQSWKTSICADVCFNTSVDSTTVRVPKHSKQEVKIYFYTSASAATGSVTINFSGLYVPANEVTMNFYGITTQNLSALPEKNKNYALISLFPSPVHNRLQLRTRLNYSEVRFIDGFGRTILQEGRSCFHDISALSNGIYFIQLFSDDGQMLGTARFLKAE